MLGVCIRKGWGCIIAWYHKWNILQESCIIGWVYYSRVCDRLGVFSEG